MKHHVQEVVRRLDLVNGSSCVNVITEYGIFYSVSDNVVRCMLGRDYDYFAKRNRHKDGRDFSRVLTKSELDELTNLKTYESFAR